MTCSVILVLVKLVVICEWSTVLTLYKICQSVTYFVVHTKEGKKPRTVDIAETDSYQKLIVHLLTKVWKN
jgi:uncharacterized membrane protein YqiK